VKAGGFGFVLGGVAFVNGGRGGGVRNPLKVLTVEVKVTFFSMLFCPISIKICLFFLIKCERSERKCEEIYRLGHKKIITPH